MKKSKKLSMPHSYVIIFAIIIFAMLLTYIVPAGNYERAVNEAGRTVVVEGTYARAEQSPVGIFQLFSCVFNGFVEVADIIFFIIFAYAWVNVLMTNGTFNGLMGAVIRKFGTKVEILIPILMIAFGALGSTMGLLEEFYGLIPVFVGIAIALGYDAIVGGAMVYIGAATGFASATMNPFTVGVAMSVAGVEYPYGLAFRIVILVIFEAVAIFYVMRYAKKVRQDPTKSLLYGTPLDLKVVSHEELANATLSTRQKLCGVAFLVTLFFIIFGALKWGWYITELSSLFLMSMIITGFIGGMNANDIAKNFVQSAKDMMFGALIVGLSRGVVVVMTSGNIIDSVIYGLAQPLTAMSNSLGAVSNYISAMGMVFVQNIINFFIASGSGQASAVMPIIAPLADVIGLSRQTAILAFQFGDGYSNMFWPTGIFMIAGLMNVPAEKWFKFVAPLFGIMFALQLVFICVAVGIGF